MYLDRRSTNARFAGAFFNRFIFFPSPYLRVILLYVTHQCYSSPKNVSFLFTQLSSPNTPERCQPLKLTRERERKIFCFFTFLSLPVVYYKKMMLCKVYV